MHNNPYGVFGVVLRDLGTSENHLGESVFLVLLQKRYRQSKRMSRIS